MVAIVLVSAPECLAAPYTLTVTASHGSVTVTPNKAQYNEGEAVELKTKPDTGYCFTGWAGDARGKSLVLNLTMNGNKTITANFGTWQPPIGIPVPEFGIFETYRMYDTPANRNTELTYTQNAEGGYFTHYIDNTDPNATNTSNSYGSLSKPRLTIPTSLPAGSVVEVHGGPYVASSYFWTFNGTDDMPAFVRGLDSAKPSFSGNEIYLWGCYFILENIDIVDGKLLTVVSASLTYPEPNYAGIRHCIVRDHIGNTEAGITAATYNKANPNTVHDIVFYDNTLYELGDFNAIEQGEDNDFTGIAISSNTNRIWVVDNIISRTTGSGIVVNAAEPNLAHHIYIGRNILYNLFQSGIGLKECSDIIISQNTVYDILSRYDPSGQVGSPGKGFSYQYGPDRVWFIFNTTYHSPYGIFSATAENNTGGVIYIIGNLIYDLYTPDEGLLGGISLSDDEDATKYILNNTIQGGRIGINNYRGTGGMHLANNIISEMSVLDIQMVSPVKAAASSISNTLFNGTAQIKWGSDTIRDIASMQSAFGECTGCVEANPLFFDPANGDFRLLPTSPAGAAATSSGVVQQVYDRFETLYGIDIRKDIEGTALTDPWDMGAYKSENRAPILAAIGNKSATVDSLLTFTISATDADADTITYSATGRPTGATLTGQTFSWTPTSTQVGTHNITFIANDGAVQDSETVTVTVTSPTNRPPVLAAIGSKSVSENSLLTFTISATDPDADTVTYSATGLPTGATLTGRTFSWRPGYTQAGTHNITFIASDGALQDSEVVAVTVSNTNRPPVLAAIGSKSASEGSLLSFSVSATDPDIDDTITYSTGALPSGAAFAGSTFAWTPGYDQAGSPTVTFTVSDGHTQDSETVTITVNNTNRAPVLDDITDKSVNENTLLTFGISATDPDGDPLSYSATGLPGGATFAGQTFSWTPSSSQADSSHQVTFIASDGQLNDSQIVTITVTDTLPPSVTNLSPAAGSIQAPLNSLIILHVIDAGKGVDAGTVTITLDGSTIYSGNTSNYVSATGNCRRIGTKADYTYAYQSSQNFDFDQAKTITVNATDLGGNVMSQQSYSFRTEMRSFGQNKGVDSTVEGLDKAAPATVRDSSGNIWAVWHAGPPGSRDIYLAKLTAGSTSFGAGAQITTDAADQCNPAVALGTDDKLYVVWQDNRLGDWDIYGSTSTNGTTWSDQQRITDTNDSQINPAIAVDHQSPNRAHVAWQDDRAGNQDIYIATSSNAFVTNTVTPITSNTANQTAPAVAVSSSNTVYVLWTDARNPSNDNDIYGAAGSGWTNVPIVMKAAGQSSPAIAVESTGSILHILWVDQTSGNSDIYYASSNGLPGSPLTGTNLIDDDTTPGAEQTSPVIAVTGSTGSSLKVFACWLDERNVSGSTGDTDIYLVQTNAGSGANVLISDGTANSNQTEPAMGTDQYGYPYIVWTDDRGANTEIYFAASTFMQSSSLASQLITAASGGTVGTDPASITGVDDVSIVLPAGACPYDVTITITKIENPHDYTLPLLNGYDFGPSGIVFNTPVTITIPYAVTGTTGTPTAGWYNSLTGDRSQQGITDIEIIVLTPSLHALRFKTTHLTPFYALLEPAAGGGGGGGGGGCSVSPAGQSSILELLVPCIGLAVVMAILKLRDTRNRSAGDIAKGKS
jgi:hypothetical protein